MSRIAIDARIWSKESGGIGRYCHNLVSELLTIDKKNEYTLLMNSEDAATLDITAPNLHTLIVDVQHYSASEQTKLLSILNKEKFDLVHFTHFNHPILYRRPFVVTVHDLIMHFFPSGTQRTIPIRRIAYKATMRDTRRAKKIIVPSEATKRDLMKWLHMREANIVITPEGSETAIFHEHSAKEIAAIKKKYDLPEKFIIFVSRWEHYKGITALVNAFEDLHKEFPELGLVITGKPRWQAPEVGKLVHAKQAQGLPIITPGFVDDTDLATLYSAASVYCHPSWYEGFGIMILEAFASGVPVVTSRTSSLPEVAGDAALLVDPREPKEITDAIREILRNPELAETLKKRGLARLKLYSWAKMAKQTHDIYEKVLAGKKSTQ